MCLDERLNHYIIVHSSDSFNRETPQKGIAVLAQHRHIPQPYYGENKTTSQNILCVPQKKCLWWFSGQNFSLCDVFSAEMFSHSPTADVVQTVALRPSLTFPSHPCELYIREGVSRRAPFGIRFSFLKRDNWCDSHSGESTSVLVGHWNAPLHFWSLNTRLPAEHCCNLYAKCFRPCKSCYIRCWNWFIWVLSDFWLPEVCVW